MSAWPPPAHPHGRGPVHIRWPRRIAGVLATVALFGVAIAMVAMIMPDGDSAVESTLPAAPAAAAKPHGKAKEEAAAAHKAPVLTAAQKQARSDAVTTLSSQGYEPVSVKAFNPRHALRVLIGHRTGDTTGPRRAFFFRSSGLVGTDSPSPSTNLKISGSGSNWVTLSYGIYATGDQPSSPSGGHVKVRFAWTGGALSPVGGTIPQTWERVLSG
jgi:LppP/LprE lipoprotein